MKRKTQLIFILLILLISGHICAQISFHIKPTIEYKSTIGYPVSTIKGGKKTLFLDNPYLQHDNYNFYPHLNLQIGLSAGVKLNEQHFFEFVYSQDMAGIGRKMNYYTYLNPESNIHQYISSMDNSYHAIHISRFTLNYQYKFFSTKNDIISLRLNVGLGIFFNKNVKGNNIPISNSWLSSDENNYVTETAFLKLVENTSFSLKRLSGLGQIGLGVDVKTKNKYLFSFDVVYTQGFQSVLSNMTRYVIFDSGIQKEYYYYTASKGSGFTYQISRRFQLYPCKSKKEKNNL